MVGRGKIVYMKQKDCLKREMIDVHQNNKTYAFIEGYSLGKNLKQTKTALALSKYLHEGQYRKDKSPYISHPLKVCSILISCGIEDDTILAASLLHDVLEDCGEKLPLNGEELTAEFHLSKEVLELIKILTKKSGLNHEELGEYFERIKNNPKALLIKLSDRLHNLATLYAFSIDKMRAYIKETDTYIIPIARYGKNYYSEYTNVFAGLKNNIYSLNHTMDVLIKKFEESSVV